MVRNGRGTTSGGSESARGGSRSAMTMPIRKMTEATRSGHCGPNQNAASADRCHDGAGDRAVHAGPGARPGTARGPRGSSRGTAARAGDPVRPGQREHPERGRVEPEAVEVVGDHPGQERPAEHGGGQRVAAAVPEVVEQRADHRCQQRERHHRDEQVERDLAAGLAERHVEEDRAGQPDRDQRVARAGRPRAGRTAASCRSRRPAPLARTAPTRRASPAAGADARRAPAGGCPGCRCRRRCPRRADAPAWPHPRPSGAAHVPCHAGRDAAGVADRRPTAVWGRMAPVTTVPDRYRPRRPPRPGVRRRRRRRPRGDHRGRPERGRRPPGGGRRGRAARHPLLRLPPGRLPRAGAGRSP